YVPDADDTNIFGYTIDSATGALTSIAGSPFFANGGSSAIAADPNGKFLYVATFPGIWGYTINPASGALMAIAGSPFAFDPTGTPSSLAVDPSGKFAYVTDSSNIAVSGYTI